jgi:ribosome modulation factor
MSDYHDRASSSSISQIEKKGFDAGLKQESLDMNPYSPGSWQHAAWEAGHRLGEEFRVRNNISISGH